MSYRIKQLIGRLALFGYCQFEIKTIIQEAIGIAYTENLSLAQSVAVINNLEKYEQLGLSYLNKYSK